MCEIDFLLWHDNIWWNPWASLTLGLGRAAKKIYFWEKQEKNEFIILYANQKGNARQLYNEQVFVTLHSGQKFHF